VRILEIGCGPVVHNIFPAAPYASEIHLADYLPRNLHEIERWLERQAGSHDWSSFIRYTLECEGSTASLEKIALREDLTRNRITRLIQADISQPDPLGRAHRHAYPIVLNCFCADSATSDLVIWSNFMRNICSLVAPGGLLISAALRHASFYKVGSHYFPSANVDERHVRSALEANARFRISSLRVEHVPEHRDQGYSGLVLAAATNTP
jgi:hypothetical protein